MAFRPINDPIASRSAPTSEQFAETPTINLELCNVNMSYKNKVILKDISLTACSGETIALLGPNGAGKSTLIEIAAGLRAPSSGKVSLLGENPLFATEHTRANVGLMLQNWKDHGKWEVHEFLAYIARASGQTSKNVDELLSALGLAHRAKSRMNTLSGGQRRRVDVAAALIGNPRILVVDEPTTGFDVEARKSFQETVLDLAGDRTVIWATHDLDEAEAVCDRIVMIANGSIIADGTPSDLRALNDSKTTLRWTGPDGARHHETHDYPNARIVEVAKTSGVTNIEVSKQSLEDVYLSIIRDAEQAATARSANATAPPATNSSDDRSV